MPNRVVYEELMAPYGRQHAQDSMLSVVGRNKFLNALDPWPPHWFRRGVQGEAPRAVATEMLKHDRIAS